MSTVVLAVYCNSEFLWFCPELPGREIQNCWKSYSAAYFGRFQALCESTPATYTLSNGTG